MTKMILEPISLRKQVLKYFEFSRQNIFELSFNLVCMQNVPWKKSVHFRERDGDPTKKRDFLLQSSITSREEKKVFNLSDTASPFLSKSSSKSRIDYSLE